MIEKEILYSLFSEKCVNEFLSSEMNQDENQKFSHLYKSTTRNFNEEIGMLVVATDNNSIYREFCSPKQGTIYEIIKLSNSFCSMHNHNYYEFISVVSGEILVQFENSIKTYTVGDSFILNTKIYHCEKFSPDSCAIYICISKEFLIKFLTYNNDYYLTKELKELFKSLSTISSNEEQAGKFYWEFKFNKSDYLKEVFHYLPLFKFEIMTGILGYRIILFGLLKRYLYFLTNNLHFVYSFNEVVTPISKNVAHEVKLYIESRRHRVNRKELEKDLHYSADYLNRTFRKHYGITIGEHQRNVCMTEAGSLLLRTNSSIAQVAEQLGFLNRTQFYRLFNEHYNMTPQQYRTRYKSDQVNEG